MLCYKGVSSNRRTPIAQSPKEQVMQHDGTWMLSHQWNLIDMKRRITKLVEDSIKAPGIPVEPLRITNSVIAQYPVVVHRRLVHHDFYAVVTTKLLQKFRTVIGDTSALRW